MPVPPQVAAQAISSAGTAVTNILGGIIGGRARRREEREARADQTQARAAYEGHQFAAVTDPTAGAFNAFAGLQAPNQNLRVATGAAQFASQRSSQDLANAADALRLGGGGSAAATALARGSAQAQQRISAGLQQQEIANQQAAEQGRFQAAQLVASGAERTQRLKAQGSQYVQNLVFNQGQLDRDRLATQYGLANERLAGAQEARQAATQSLLKGLGGGADALSNSSLFKKDKD